jgi:hypothetical protein
MKKWFAAALLALPLSANAYHLDVIEMEILEDCSFGELMQIVGDFNRWGQDHGYNARVARPIQGTQLDKVWWMGTSENAATYGAAWDSWRDALADAESVPAKLSARLGECVESNRRSGYDVF